MLLFQVRDHAVLTTDKMAPTDLQNREREREIEREREVGRERESGAIVPGQRPRSLNSQDGPYRLAEEEAGGGGRGGERERERM